MGWNRYTNGTVATTPASFAAASMASASAELVASGFSQTTCLPAAIDCQGLLGMHPIGCADMYNVDLSVRQQFLQARDAPFNSQRGRGFERPSFGR